MSSAITQARGLRRRVVSRVAALAVLAAALLAAGAAPASAASVDLALNASGSGYPSPLQSDAGWGGGSYPWDLTDGLHAYNSWARGLAFTGGRSSWAGQPCGPRQATIDFGSPKTFNDVVMWHHGIIHTPADAAINYWDGSAWHDVPFTRTYGAVTEDGTNAGYSTSDEYRLHAAVTGSKVKWSMNNCEGNFDGTLTPLEHGWLYEFEVFNNSDTSVNGESNLTATVGPYLALAGGAASFSIVPTIGESSYTSNASLQVSTSSPTGVAVTVTPSTSVQNLGIPGASVWAASNGAPSTFQRLGSAGVNVLSAPGPVNQAFTVPYRLDLAAGTVLRNGDAYGEPITYAATAALP